MAQCTCYNPLIGIRDENIKTKSGKAKVFIKSRHDFNVPYDELMKRNNVFPIPCGHCIGCRLRYARNWANRLMLEASLNKQNWFVTLTYSDDNLRWSKDSFKLNAYFPSMPTLEPDDFTKFMKRLRITLSRKFSDKPLFKYYMCGEYGDKFGRPHYHFIGLGLELDDLYYWNKSKSGKPQFRSPLLEKCWPYGHVTVSECNWKTCAYVARYVLKKQVLPDVGKNNEKIILDEMGLQYPYVRMSNGISKDFYEGNFEQIYKYDEVNLSTPQGGLSFKPPRYFDNLFEQYSPDDMEAIRGIRQDQAKESFAALLGQLEIPYEDYLHMLDDKSRAVKKALIRLLD